MLYQADGDTVYTIARREYDFASRVTITATQRYFSMKLHTMMALATIALAAAAPIAAAQDQSVAIEVQAINQLSFAGSPSLVISSGTAGSAPTSATASVT